jgi:hypothetical protein
MRRHADAAVTTAKEALTQDPENLDLQRDLAGFRLNVARITQYFDRDSDGALKTYRDIIAELSLQEPESKEAARVKAAAGRNAAECLFDSAPRPLSRDRREQAEEIITRASTAANRHDLVELANELQYSKARLLQAAGDAVAAQSILRDVIQSTRREHFPLLEAIASDRDYWLSVRAGGRPFVFEEAQARLAALEKLDWHAWALRVSLRSRLRISKHLLASGRTAERDLALSLLERNKDLSKVKRGLVDRFDQTQIAQTYAGLELSSALGDHPWEEFLHLDWASTWMEGARLATPALVWESVA